MTLIEDISRFVGEFDASRIPPEILERARISLLDSLACAVGALEEASARSVLDLVHDLGTGGECSVIGRPWRASLPGAVLANGVLVRSLDLNDFFGGDTITGHPSDNIPVALASVQAAGGSGRDLLAAIVLAYELYHRLHELLTPAGPWDHVSLSGLVAPAVVSKLLSFDETSTAHALALGAVHAPTSGGIRDGNISSAKTLANAVVAQQGVQAALLAQRGLTGPLGVFESRRGLGRSVFTETPKTGFAQPLDGRYRIAEAHIKAYPCVATAQALVAAAERIHAVHKPAPSGIRRVRFVMADVPAARAHVGNDERRRPGSREAADHSFDFLLAVALIDGELTVRQYAGERWKDPEVRALMECVESGIGRDLVTRAPNSFPCKVTVTMKDGREFDEEVLYAPGHANNPFTFRQAAEKFSRCTRGILGSEGRESLIEAIEKLGDVSSLGDFTKLLSTHMPPTA